MAGTKRRDWRFLAGAAATALWLGAGYYFWLHYKHPDDLNGLGGFFSGFFAPVAFLWLVLGYLQQSEELKHSTEALRLQAEELRNSVEQQRDLVDVTRQQLQRELETIQEERELRRRAALPKFVLHHADTSGGAFGMVYSIVVTNVGNTATALVVSANPPVGNFTRVSLPLLQRNQETTIGINSGGAFESALIFSFYDADGLPGEIEVPLVCSEANQITFGTTRETARNAP